MEHAMAAALIPVPQKPTHIQLRKKGAPAPDSASDVNRIRATIMQDSLEREQGSAQGGGTSRGERRGIEADAEMAEEMWASCLYDAEFSSMKAPEPDEGLPRHRTAHVHRFDMGLGPNQIMYMPTCKSVKLMEALAPAVRYIYNHQVVALLENEGKHRIVAQKTDAPDESRSGEPESETNVWQRGATGGTSRVTTGETDYSGRASSRQGILKRQASPPRMSTATGNCPGR